MQIRNGIPTIIFPPGEKDNVGQKADRKLSRLLRGSSLVNQLGTLDKEISSIAYDSRKVEPGGLFVAIPGLRHDGSQFIREAIRHGAEAFVTEVPLDSLLGAGIDSSGVTAVQVEDCRAALSRMGAEFYNRPTERMSLIGVTGTNGKTTLTYILEQIYKGCEIETGVIGTIRYRFADFDMPAPITTPESLELNRMFDEMLQKEIRTCFLEVSSHSLALKRVYGMHFSVAVFSNLSRDHLDFHGTMEHYKNAKKSLFRDNTTDCRVINIDDPVGREILEESSRETLTTGIDHPADVMAENCILTDKGSRFHLKTPSGNREIETRLLGRHNIHNLLSATSVALLQGVSLDDIDRGLRSVGRIPGRFERLDCGQDFTVVIDYAHTGDALKNVLQAARAFTKNKIIIVFGCGGDRDKGKRREMGRVALELSDFAFITSDNPRSEDPDYIIDGILEGVPSSKNKGTDYSVFISREEAIDRAIDMARAGDTVIIAGKGHEDYQILDSGTIHFDDREVAGQFLKRKLGLD